MLAELETNIAHRIPHLGRVLQSGKLSLYWGSRKLVAREGRAGLDVTIYRDAQPTSNLTVKPEHLPALAQTVLA